MRYLWILFLLIFSSSAIGQADLVTKKGSKYYYKGDQYKCKELGIIYKDSEEAMDIYSSGRKNVKSANFTAYLGIALIVVGLGVAVNSDSFQGVIAGSLSIVIGLVVEVVALVPLGIGKGKIRKAMNIFNFDMIERHGYQEEPSVSLGVTKNGIGLVYHF